MSNEEDKTQWIGRILIIDDDLDLLYSLRDLLEMEDRYEIATTSDANSAKDLLTTFNPDVALVDIRLGTSDGIELIVEMKQALPDLNCIMMTAHREISYCVDALRAGADDYLFKPTDPERLLSLVDEFLRQGRINQFKENNERNLKTMMDHTSGFIFLLSPDGLCLEAGYAALSFINQDWENVKSTLFWDTPWWDLANIERSEIKNVFELASSGKPSNFEANITDYKGNQSWFEFSLKPVFTEDKQVSLIIAEGKDLTKYKIIEENLKKISLYDPLTGLANRTLLQEHTEVVLSRSIRGNTKFSVIFIDLDQFKAVNDTLGHQAGDELLISVGKCLKSCLRDEDIVSRIGGDEFVITLISEQDRLGTSKVAERLIQSVASLKFEVREDMYVTASVGIAVYPDDGEDIMTIMRNADAAMYMAKQKGKNCFQYFKD